MCSEGLLKSTIAAVSAIGGRSQEDELNQQIINQFILPEYPGEIRKDAYKFVQVD